MKMARFSHLTLKQSLVRRRWLIVAFISVIVLAMESIEHRPSRLVAPNGNLLLETLLFAITLPLLLGVTLSALHTRSKLVNTISQFDNQRVMRQHLSDAHDWDELVTILLQIPRTMLPLVGDSLIVSDPTIGKYELIASWCQEGRELPVPFPLAGSANCSLCMVQQSNSSSICIPCVCLKAPATKSTLGIFCLPLGHADQWNSLLILYLEPGVTPEPGQISSLIELCSDMNLNVERLQLRHMVVGQTSAAELERQRVARYLHDTLAHNVAFLRLKLEQLSGAEKSNATAALQIDIDRMLEIANQSYGQVRSLLTKLMEEPATDFVTVLTDCAATIAARANFTVEIHEDGPTREIPPQVQRQIIYLAREALRNIEKHAHAQKVNIVLNWQNDSVAITIADNGQGLDLNTPENGNGHYGLHILEEYTQELNGQFTLTSAPGAGTQINLWFPLDSNPVRP